MQVSKENPTRIPLAEAESTKIGSLLIVDRGGIAVRAVEACIKRGIQAIVAYAPEDSKSVAVRMAKKLGFKRVPIDRYDDQEAILNIARSNRYNNCAIFTGVGALAEKIDFTSQCEAENLRILCPPSGAMRIVADKLAIKKAAEDCDISVLPGIELHSLDDAIKGISELKFPVMLKITNRGGGMGNRVAHNDDELKTAYGRLEEKLKEDPNGKMLMEHFIEKAVHVEVQIAADKQGHVVSLGGRNCSAQIKYQKRFEEADDNIPSEIHQAAIALAKHTKYVGLGTVEFIIDKGKSEKTGKLVYYLLETNARMQVEYGVTEAQTDIDMINLFMDINEGNSLPFSQEDVRSQGHTVEVRLCAEDPKNNFMVSPGKIKEFSHPTIEGVTVNTGIRKKGTIYPWQHLLIALIISHGKNREEAILKLIKCLENTKIKGIKTNREFMIHFLKTPELRNGQVTTTFLERCAEEWAEKKRGKPSEEINSNPESAIPNKGVIFEERGKNPGKFGLSGI